MARHHTISSQLELTIGLTITLTFWIFASWLGTGGVDGGGDEREKQRQNCPTLVHHEYSHRDGSDNTNSEAGGGVVNAERQQEGSLTRQRDRVSSSQESCVGGARGEEVLFVCVCVRLCVSVHMYVNMHRCCRYV